VDHGGPSFALVKNASSGVVKNAATGERHSEKSAVYQVTGGGDGDGDGDGDGPWVEQRAFVKNPP